MSSTLSIVTRLGLEDNGRQPSTPEKVVDADVNQNQPQQALDAKLKKVFEDALQNSPVNLHTPLD